MRDPARTHGQFVLVLNGELVLGGERLAPWSIAYAATCDPPLTLTAGTGGLEALMLEFPRGAVQ